MRPNRRSSFVFNVPTIIGQVLLGGGSSLPKLLLAPLDDMSSTRGGKATGARGREGIGGKKGVDERRANRHEFI